MYVLSFNFLHVTIIYRIDKILLNHTSNKITITLHIGGMCEYNKKKEKEK